MRVLIVGDIVGAAGLACLEERLPRIKVREKPDLTIVNGENTHEGKGIRPSDANAIMAAGADVITSGNHIWERWQSKKVLEERERVLRPHNYPPGNAGSGICSVDVGGRTVWVVNLQGRTFLPDIDCPFRAIDTILDGVGPTDPVIVDFHAEATAEKIAFARYVEGRVTLVAGTHTHVPTADAQILPRGTAFVCDLGMTGPYQSVIGMKIQPAVNRFLYMTPFKYESAEGDPRLCGAIVTVADDSGRALGISQVIEPPFPTGLTGWEDDSAPDATSELNQNPIE